jgi:hypothetical protein
MKVLGEYWLATDSPAVMLVAEVSSYEPIMEVNLYWGDKFDIVTLPATVPEEGLRMGQPLLQRRGERQSPPGGHEVVAPFTYPT